MSDIAITHEQRPVPAIAKPITAAASLAALGIVYGDLGTSPLYTTCRRSSRAVGGQFSPEIGLGILSLIFWALVITVSIKYCLFVMRADNHGEGGILALMSLVAAARLRARMPALVMMGLFGAALIYGDGVITPAISVLSALEGVNVASDALKPYVMPLGVVILVVLFAVQRRGTARIGGVFGPVMLVWFVVIGILGIAGIVRHPGVLRAVDPAYGVVLPRAPWVAGLRDSWRCIPGADRRRGALRRYGPYRPQADPPDLVRPRAAGAAAQLRRPDRTADRRARQRQPLLPPGAQLGALPAGGAGDRGDDHRQPGDHHRLVLADPPGDATRMVARGSTSARPRTTEYGQIYVPAMNWLMMVMTVALTVGFGSSERLAGAYGTAVSTTMLLTTALLFNADARASGNGRSGWRRAAPAYSSSSTLASSRANLLKIVDGGWVPLTFGAIVFIIMATWHAGISAVHTQTGR